MEITLERAKLEGLVGVWARPRFQQLEGNGGTREGQADVQTSVWGQVMIKCPVREGTAKRARKNVKKRLVEQTKWGA